MSRRLNIDRHSDDVLAIDIGGTNMRVGIVSRNGDIKKFANMPSGGDGSLEIAAVRLRDASYKLADGVPLYGVGLATAGPVVPWTGEYVYPPSLGAWHGKSFKPLLEEWFDTPLQIGHDATAAAFAEIHYGPYEHQNHLVYVTVSTGIGCGIVTNGQLMTGANGLAGEGGHILIKPGSGYSCNVGCDGCFESAASGSGIVNILKLKYEPGAKTRLASKIEDGTLNARDIFRAAESNDRLAQEVVNEFVDNMAIGVSSLLNLMDPDAITVGGGVAVELGRYWDEFIDAVKKHALPRFRNAVPVHLSTLDPNAPMLGAAALVFFNPK